jgi:hypothetical protein
MPTVFKPLATEFLVNSETIGGQFDPRTARLSNGGFVICWVDLSGTLEDVSASSVKAQMYDAAGDPVGAEFLVNTITDSFQWMPAIAGLSTGGFIVTWVDLSGTLGDDDGSSIKAQIYDAAGTRVGTEFLVNSQIAGDQSNPVVTALANGGFVVSWKDLGGTLGDANGSSIKAQVFSAAGVKLGEELRVNTEVLDDQLNPVITSLSSGGFVVSWTDNSGTLGDASGSSIKAQIFSSGGTRLGAEFLVNSQTSGDQLAPTIAALSGGKFVVAWRDQSGTLGDAAGSSIKAQIYTDAGVKVGGEFIVNSQVFGDQSSPSITALAGGGFAISWADASGTLGDASGTSIKAQVYDGDGVKIGTEFLVNTETRFSQALPSISGLSDGGFVIGWQDPSGTLGDSSSSSIKARMYFADANPTPPEITFLGGGAAAELFSAENKLQLGAVTAVAQDAGSTLSFFIDGGADANKFVIDKFTGQLSFLNNPDFEAPVDSGANNVYDVIIGVSDGYVSSTQRVTVIVTDVDEGILQYYRPGPEGMVNTAIAGDQLTPKIATLADGGFVMAWATNDASQDGSETAVKLQIYAANGTKYGAELVVNSQTAGTQNFPAITGLVDGGFVVAWTTSDSGQDGSGAAIKAQLFGSDGTKLGAEFLVNTSATGGQVDPVIASLSDGGFVVSWVTGDTVQDGSDTAIKAQIFAADGTKVGSEFLVNSARPAGQVDPAVTGLANGGFVISWVSNDTAQDGSGTAIKAQVFAADGVKVGTEFLVNSASAGTQTAPDVAALADGGFVVSWTTNDPAQDGSESAIKAQVFAAGGAKIGSEFLVNSASSGAQLEPAIKGLASGGFVVSWTTNDPVQDGSGSAIKVQLFAADGTKVGSEFLVNSEFAGMQSSPALASASNGGFVMSWMSGEPEPGGSGSSIKASLFELIDPLHLQGTSGDDRLASRPANEVINGLAGFDTAVYTGLRLEYDVTRIGDTVTVKHLQPGGDGTDTLLGIERLQFADGIMGLVPEELVLFLPGSRDLITWDSTQGSNGFTYFFRLNATTNVAAVADFTGDGRTDLLLSQPNGGLIRWDPSQGGNGFSVLPAAPGFEVAGIGDLIGNGADDVLLRNASGQLRMLDTTTGLINDLFALAPGWSLKGVANINGTGKDDVILQNNTSGAVIAFTDEGWRDLITLAPGSGWEIAGLGDVVGGLADDFIFRNSNTGVTIFWDTTDSVTGFHDFATIGQGWNLTKVSDLSGDGRDDVVYQNTNGLAIYWNGNAWVDLGSTLVGAEFMGTGLFI